MKTTQLNTYTTKELKEMIEMIEDIKNLISFRKKLSSLIRSNKVDISEVYKKRGAKPKWLKEIIKESKKK